MDLSKGATNMIDFSQITRDECLTLDRMEARSVHVRQALRSAGDYQVGAYAKKHFSATEWDILVRIGAAPAAFYEQIPLCPFCHETEREGHDC